MKPDRINNVMGQMTLINVTVVLSCLPHTHELSVFGYFIDDRLRIWAAFIPSVVVYDLTGPILGRRGNGDLSKRFDMSESSFQPRLLLRYWTREAEYCHLKTGDRRDARKARSEAGCDQKRLTVRFTVTKGGWEDIDFTSLVRGSPYFHVQQSHNP